VKLNLACKRFRKLWNDRDVRELSKGELGYLDRHKEMCDDCREFELSSALSLGILREATLEPEVSVGFDERVLRKVRVQTVRESLGYWSPALIGAGIACIAIFAAVQIAAIPVQPKRALLPDGEARRSLNSDNPLPRLILENKPLLDQ
jgi:hypothetical protein